MWYLHNCLTDFDQIWYVDAYGHSGPFRALKFALFKIQDDGRPPSWKIEKSPHLSNGLTVLDEICQHYADWVSGANWPLKMWIFKNSRWRRPPIWKTIKSRYLRNCLTNFDGIWYFDAYGHPGSYWALKIAFLRWRTAAILKKRKIADMCLKGLVVMHAASLPIPTILPNKTAYLQIL